MKGVLSKFKKRWPQDSAQKGDTSHHHPNHHHHNSGSGSGSSSSSSNNNNNNNNNYSNAANSSTATTTMTTTTNPARNTSSGAGRTTNTALSNGNPNGNIGGKTTGVAGGNGVADVLGGSRAANVANTGVPRGPVVGGGRVSTTGGSAGTGGGDRAGVSYSPPLDATLGQRRLPSDKLPPPGPGAMGQLPGGTMVAPISTTTQMLRNNGVEETPVVDVSLPRRPSQTISRRSASFESSRSTEPHVRQEFLKELPLLRNTSPHQQEALFQQKLKLCSVVFDMTDPMENSRDKEVKRSTLLELVDHVNSPHGQQIFTVAVMPDVVAMVKANVCRALPPQPDDCDADKEEPLLEEAWPHLQVVYEFLVRFVVSSEVDAKQAKQYVDQSLCLQLVELFDSEDPRERDYLKTILHRVYGKFMMHRAFIRRAVGNAFLRFVYECPRHNGIGELLEILGSIVNGFATPLKKEHVDFLQVCVLPLHTPSMVNAYHQQLSYCVVQYVEKEAETATHILKSLIRFWPWRSSSKQVIFLNELEEVLELLVGSEQIAEVEDQLFKLLSRCISSEHFQVAERALFLWNNEHLVTVGVLSPQYPTPLLPVIYGPLWKRSTKHWNTTVEGLAHNVLRMYKEQDSAAFDRCHQRYLEEEQEWGRRRQRADAHWLLLEELAQAKAGE